ncbi:MAG: hypothetical protein OHK0029_40800 [Armatimonadaceae bacterium]
MRVILKPAAVVTLLLVVIGLAGYAVYWQTVASAERTPGTASGMTLPFVGTPEVTIVVSGTRKSWVEAAVSRFQEKSGLKASIKLEQVESREALQQILNSKSKPVIWVVDNALWADRLHDVWQEQVGGTSLFEPANVQDFRPLARTPPRLCDNNAKSGGVTPISGTRAGVECRA